MDWEYVPLESAEVRDALLMVGVPSVGMVGPIAAGFLAEHLGMRVIGGLQNEAMPPAGVVRKGVVTSPVQLWETDVACGLDGRCDKLLVLKSEIPLPPPLMMSLASMVSGWAKKEGVGLAVGLEGYVTEEDAGEGNDLVLCAASLAGQEAAASVKGASQVEEAILTGFNAALLVRANRDRLPAVGLFAPVAAQHGDARAAARLLEMVDPLVPNIQLKPGELLKRAEAVEAELQHAQDLQARAERRLLEQSQRGYV